MFSRDLGKDDREFSLRSEMSGTLSLLETVSFLSSLS